MKAEAGLCEGQVLYHAHVKKSAQEADAQQAAVDARAAEKTARRKQQVRGGCAGLGGRAAGLSEGKGKGCKTWCVCASHTKHIIRGGKA